LQAGEFDKAVKEMEDMDKDLDCAKCRNE